MLFSWLASVLALGGLTSLLLVEPKDFGTGFHALIGVLASLFLAAGLAGGTLRGSTGWAALLSTAGWVLLTRWGRVPWIRPSLLVPVLLTGVSLLAGSESPPRASLLTLGMWVAPGNAVAASLLLGSVSLAMLLGHWYLVIPGLPIRHLRRMTWFLAVCIALRAALGLVSLGAARPIPALGVLSAWQVAGGITAFFFWQRVAIGLVAPAILTFMVDRTVRISSTQSATGLLFVAMIFVLVGEMISRFLFVSMGIPQ